MSKIFYVGQCPICREYGRLEIDKYIMKNECIVICEECLAEWKNPEEALKNVNGKRGGEKGVAIPASFDEIKALGWDRFVTKIVEE